MSNICVYIDADNINSKYFIDTEIYGIGTETPLYSGKKDDQGCYSGNWFFFYINTKIFYFRYIITNISLRNF